MRPGVGVRESKLLMPGCLAKRKAPGASCKIQVTRREVGGGRWEAEVCAARLGAVPSLPDRAVSWQLAERAALRAERSVCSFLLADKPRNER